MLYQDLQAVIHFKINIFQMHEIHVQLYEYLSSMLFLILIFLSCT